MAIALEKLEDQLNCTICLDTYTNPKQLWCHHVYCQQCLVKLVFRDQQGQLILTCPNCRQATPVPANGVAGLQAAFQINKLLEIVEEHKKTTVSAASLERDENASVSHDTPLKDVRMVCSEHKEKEVELYCETCEETMCWECIMIGSKHHNHQYDKIGSAFEQYREVILSSLDPLERQLTTIEKALHHLSARGDEISDRQRIVEADIHSSITRIHETLEVRRTELISQLHQLTQVKLKSLAEQRDLLETTQARLSNCLLLMRENLETGSHVQALLRKSTTVRQVKELTTAFQPDVLEPNMEADMIFSELADLSAEVRQYGDVQAANCLLSYNCHVTGTNKDIVKVGKKFTVTLQMLNPFEQPCNVITSDISCEVASEIAAIEARGSLERRRRGQNEISYLPTIKGRYQLHIKVDDQHIRGSPFCVSASTRPQIETFGTPILVAKKLQKPVGVAINHRGEAVVAEFERSCVTTLSTSLERQQSFGTKGTSQTHLQNPTDVAVDSENNILVCDTKNHRIQKFTAQGEFITAVGTQGKGMLQFDHPRGIMINAANSRVYVVDSENSRVQILNSNLSYHASFGEKGRLNGQLENPRGIACDSNGNVYVAEKGQFVSTFDSRPNNYGNHRIQVFTADGKFLRAFGSFGTRQGELVGPNGIAIDSCDRVYVSEWGNHRISVFTAEGQFVTSFGSSGRKPGQFRCPTGLAIDSSGVLYVCEYENNRVQLF